MLCERCMTIKGTGTRYEQKKGQNKSSHRRYYECRKCHDRVYVNSSNFQETLMKIKEKK